MSNSVQHQQDRSRFALNDGDGTEIGFLSYVTTADAIVIDHTVVDPAHQGQGLAAVLTDAALTTLGEQSALTIVPQCPYVAAFIRKHPEYQPLTTR
ncbi:GNAT family N-acetyltransferase [Pseudoclavibacter sp. RFBB5]|jgi:predicted GNAT family acetyltransferase|uniref:GNAT family N-acetyltransferase n=1 Tax=Pseudoclavibacter sp. RFBB5 TaxID=2080574 RepID=UPI000CE875C2|nr:GNAT family N-acetyltransferase [Pseudoclavibacter sp. RFBB5]PPG32322.1 GNAT family N-acetyltransferase [Pseudoclavibacter sp. RFBB5]